MASKEWYEVVAGSLLMQGDIIPACPVIIPSPGLDAASDTLEGIQETHEVIIATQSCDLEDKKIPFAIVCPLFDLQAYATNLNSTVAALGNSLRKGYQPSLYLLHAAEGELTVSYRVAELVRPLPVPIALLEQRAVAAGRRLRLRPPYREHFSQAFGFLFSRVALDEPLPDFRKLAS